MAIDTDILDNCIEPIGKPSKFFALLVILLSTYFLFFLFDLFFDLDHFTLKKLHLDWALLLITFIIPGIGFIFFIKRKKMGWIISLIYFLLIFFALIATEFLDIGKSKVHFSIPLLTLRQYFIITLATCISIFLLSKDIRIYFKIKLWIVITVILFSLSLAITMVQLA